MSTKKKLIPKNSPHFMTVVELIARHRAQQLDDFLSHNAKVRRLVESLGRVAEAVESGEAKRRSINNREELRYSLLELSANAVAWLEALEVKP